MKAFGNSHPIAGPVREILPGGTKTDTGRLTFGFLVEICINV